MYPTFTLRLLTVESKHFIYTVLEKKHTIGILRQYLQRYYHFSIWQKNTTIPHFKRTTFAQKRTNTGLFEWSFFLEKSHFFSLDKEKVVFLQTH